VLGREISLEQLEGTYVARYSKNFYFDAAEALAIGGELKQLFKTSTRIPSTWLTVDGFKAGEVSIGCIEIIHEPFKVTLGVQLRLIVEEHP
jgi:hypothetical protein